MPIDLSVFHKNRSAFPLEKLDPYLGDWVAWSFDGSEIIAHSAVSEQDVRDQLRGRGLEPIEYAISYLPGPEDEFDGAFILSRGKEMQRSASDPSQGKPTTSN